MVSSEAAETKTENANPNPNAVAEVVEKTDGTSGDGYLQHLSIDKVFGRMWHVFKQKWRLFLGIAALAVLIQYVLTVLLNLMWYHVMGDVATSAQQPSQLLSWHHDMTRRFLEDAVANDDAAAAADDAYVMDDAVAAGDDYYNNNAFDEYDYDQGEYAPTSPWMFLVSAVHNALYYIILAVSDGALIRAVTEIYAHQTPTTSASLRTGLSRAAPLILTPLLIAIAVGVPLLILLILTSLVPHSAAYLLFMIVAFVGLIFLRVGMYAVH